MYVVGWECDVLKVYRNAVRVANIGVQLKAKTINTVHRKPVLKVSDGSDERKTGRGASTQGSV